MTHRDRHLSHLVDLGHLAHLAPRRSTSCRSCPPRTATTWCAAGPGVVCASVPGVPLWWPQCVCVKINYERKKTKNKNNPRHIHAHAHAHACTCTCAHVHMCTCHMHMPHAHRMHMRTCTCTYMCNSTTAAKTPLLHSLPQTSETLRNLGPRPEMRKKARPP